eukprot:CAMPEP_0194213630 /NCGR_PEP_ID=MMETSP0156-20130528/14363_1 /TAXON_ID=33649 /ORGANISM="Thalassionema nitzschioides, Strain L26-B" /LENGTH=206 /DNA_ID=CAMNT_0038941705 /DNA_START=151 /DNA_END=771 /DNA_ORIENTATION=+
MNILLLAALGVVAISSTTKFLGPPLIAALVRKKLPCEGYYPDTDICLALGTIKPKWYQRNRDNAGCPQWRIDPNWGHEGERQDFIKKLQEIEDIAKGWEIKKDEGCDSGDRQVVEIRTERGVAWSRMQDGIMAGNSEYRRRRQAGDDESGHETFCWTDALLPIYVKQYSVKTSDEFRVFVSMFDVDSFRQELQAMKTRCASEQKHE